MKFSYFNNGNSRFGLTSIARGFTAILSTLLPKFSALLGENVLMKPYSRRTYDFEHVTAKKGTGKTVFYTEFTRPYEDTFTNQKTKKKKTKIDVVKSFWDVMDLGFLFCY